MSRRGLDIEQQLRERQRQQQHQHQHPATDDSQLRYVEWVFLSPAMPSIMVLVVVTLVAAVVMCSRVFPRRENRDAAQTVSLLASQASVISTACTPRACTFAFLGWVLLITTHASFSVMRMAARKAREGGSLAPVALSEFSLSPFGLSFALELAGALASWAYLLYLGGHLEVGALATLPAFLPAFYESMLLDGTEADRVAAWVTHFVFLPSLFLLTAMVTPWVRREYRNARAQLNQHTQHALFKDRPEFKDLRTRAQRDLQTRKEQ